MYPVPPFLTAGSGAMIQAFFGLIGSMMVMGGVAAQHVQPCSRNLLAMTESYLRAAGFLAYLQKAGGGAANAGL